MNQQGANYQYPPDYSHYYDPNYWQNYGQWGNYGYDPSGGGGGYSTGYDPNSAAYAQYGGQYPAQYGGQYPNQYGSYPPPTGGYPHPPYPGYYPPQTPAAGPPPPTAPVTSVPPPTAATAPVDDANEVVEHSTPVDVEKENREYADAILNYWVDLASNYGTSKDIFEDEMSKLNVVEVSNPSVTIKFETRLAAKRAVEAQGQEGLMGSASSDSSDSEEPDAKKRRLSADAKSSDESGKESSVKKEDAEVTNEAEDGVTVRQEQVTKDSDELAERINAEDVEATFDVNTEKVEDAEAKEKMKTECGKVFGFMASVDVDIMMNETERVSSDSSGDSSDSDGEGDSNQKGKVKKSKSKEKPEDKMNTDSAEKSSANNERGDAGESQPDRTGDVTKEDDVATSNGDKMATSVAEEAAEDLRQENVFIDEMKEMSETSDGEQTDRVSIQPVIEEPGNTVDETGQLARETPNPQLASKSPKSAADLSEDQSEAFITVEECLDGSPDAEPLNVQPSSIIDCDGESNNSLDELAKADPTSEFTFDTLLNGQEGYSPKEDQSLSNSPQQVQNLDSSEESD